MRYDAYREVLLLFSRLALLRGCAASLAIFAMVAMRAQAPDPRLWGDQRDGTFANPVLPADFSDIDAIRVEDDFYAVTSTFQYSPGFAVLHSKDLVHWSFVGHVVDDVTRIDPELNWNRMGRAGRGIWAGSIRFHAGRFWVYFGTPDQGIFMSSAAEPAGPWTPVKLVLAAAGWDDPCPFWDDDGKAYLVATHFAEEVGNGKTYNIHLFEMSADGERLLPGKDRILHQSQGSEANKLYKIDGTYFHFYSEVKDEGRVVMMERSKSLVGPWEIRQLIHVNAKADKEPNQGGLVELRSGKWYFLSHQGTGDWEGRAGVLLPVTWIEGWPVPGRVGKDGIGNMVWRAPLPLRSVPAGEGIAVSDDFSGARLKAAWEWNYQPRAGAWSLSERPGFLRLHAGPPLRPGDLRSVPNILTQRALRVPVAEATVKLDLAGMKEGQEVGLLHYAKDVCSLKTTQGEDGRLISFAGSAGRRLAGDRVWLRSRWGLDGIGRFSFSTDGASFVPIGKPCKAGWANYRGDRVGVYTVGSDGYIDIDSFTYTVE